ncbi:diguanylate cyclase [Glaciimonas sp. Gout2]|uniref:diguanylate cyclase n=1 Tax=unclassified Glaciimonas TaxID=2644401 RepID=UPI002B22C78D|nr:MULTISPECIES: diguanylate cyclase [unclassified Glaciimonas]MEB0013551.1 diguanylate cyclase [Glaciimonas sp. Cout2]MEB0083248.1 diguanylate cyclase [Glaciimonas sp. Gout2]
MPAIGLNHYNLRAPHDLMMILRDFYCDVVGLEEGARPAFNSVGFWLYAGGRPILHLSQAMNEIASEAVQEVPSDALLGDAKNTRPNTFDHVAFTCINQAEMRARLALHQVVYKVALVQITRQTQLFFKDPAGNGIELNFEEEIG